MVEGGDEVVLLLLVAEAGTLTDVRSEIIGHHRDDAAGSVFANLHRGANLILTSRQARAGDVDHLGRPADLPLERHRRLDHRRLLDVVAQLVVRCLRT